MTDDDHALRRVGPVVRIIDPLTLDPLVQTGLPSGGQIGLGLGLHELRVVVLRDPVHSSILLSRRVRGAFCQYTRLDPLRQHKTGSAYGIAPQGALWYNHNDHRMAKSIEDSIDFAAKQQVWQRMIL